jgi:hypothetical protein
MTTLTAIMTVFGAEGAFGLPAWAGNCPPECIQSNGESSALSGFRNGRSDPGRKAAKGDDTAGADGGGAGGMDTTDRLPIALTCAAYRQPGDARQQLSGAHPPG